MTAALLTVRFIHFAAAMAAFGIAAFRVYGLAGVPDSAARNAFDASLRRATLAGSAVALVSALLVVPCVAAEMVGRAAAFGPPVLEAVLLDTSFGHAWSAHVALAAVLVLLSALPPRHEFAGATAIAALLTLASLGWVGHAAMGQGVGGIGREINQMAHLAAGGLWLGGLLPLYLLLRRASAARDTALVPVARMALPHFSQMGYAAVALVAFTGAVNAVLLVGSLRALVGTPYGRLLLVKLALFGAMVALALSNRFRLLPRLRASGDATRPLRALCRSVAVEQALGLALLAVVAVLGTWPPAILVTR